MTKFDKIDNEAIVHQVLTGMFDLVVEGDIERAKRIAMFFDIDYDEFIEEYQEQIVLAKLKRK